MVALPSDFLSMRAIYIDTSPRVDLVYLSPHALREQWAGVASGIPRNYTIIGNELIFGPEPNQQYTVKMSYRRDLTPLSADNQTNWLLEKHSDIYLFAALAHAEFYGWNDERLPLIKNQLDQWINDLNQHGIHKQTGGAPLAPKGPRSVYGVRA